MLTSMAEFGQKQPFITRKLPVHIKIFFATLVLVLSAVGCSDHISRGKEVASPDGESYLIVDELDGPACEAPTVDGKLWNVPLHTPGKISAGEHKIACAAPITFVVRAGTIFHFEYWGP